MSNAFVLDHVISFCPCCGKIFRMERDTGSDGQDIFLGICHNGTHWRMENTTGDGAYNLPEDRKGLNVPSSTTIEA